MAAITLRPTTESRNEKVGLDWWLLCAAIFLAVFGVAEIFSAGNEQTAGDFKKQIGHILLGLVPTSVFAFCHPRLWAKAARYVYLVNLAMLAAVLAVGKGTNGADRWLKLGPVQFQPSELSKILIVLTLATFYASRQDRIKSFSTFALGFLHVFVPVLLIMEQPHLGASLLILCLWVALSLVAGVSPKYMLIAVGSFVVLTTLVFKSPTVRGVILKPYQWERVLGMLGLSSKGKSVRDNQYQVQMASYAFANGGVAGTGYLKGEVKKQVPFVDTDFIFAAVGEEFGMMGCFVLLGVFALLFYRIWLGMLSAADLYYQLIMAGILTIFGFHLIVNAGMVLGVLPVVGMWLPFLSYGGTAIWLCMSLVGLALNVRARERAVLF
ncbi:MAG: FtsW/RodA/SpoVE family cell cycle protein, partial [Armatimonadota bacterium]